MSYYNRNNYNSSGKMTEEEDYVQPWWLDGNDDDLHRTAYDDETNDDGMVDSNASAMAIVELAVDDRRRRSTATRRDRDSSEEEFDNLDSRVRNTHVRATSARRDKKAKTPTPTNISDRFSSSTPDSTSPEHSSLKSSDYRKSSSRNKERRPNRSSKNANVVEEKFSIQQIEPESKVPSISSSSPTREKIKAWTETGKSKLRHVVDTIAASTNAAHVKSTSKAKSETSSKSATSTTMRWNCRACTYLNVCEDAKDRTCEICGTPAPKSESGRQRDSVLPGATVYRDEIPCDPADVIEQTLIEEGDHGMQAMGSTRGKQKTSPTSSLPFQSTFERLFYQKRQNSSTTAETCPAASSEDFEQVRNHDNPDSRSDTASSSLGSGRIYSVAELVSSLGADNVELPPALERRVRDFKFAQTKRRERHGDQRPWGIYGLYAHLSDIRADLEWAEDAAWRRQRGQPYLSWRDFDKSRDRGFHNRPWFTYGVMALCTIMMFVTLGVNGWKFEPLNINPLIGPSSETLIKCGARKTDLIVNESQWYRLFTPMILHAGVIHYIVNIVALYLIGGAVEQSHGFASAAVLFIIPAVGGNILSAICLPQYISVGASGGIFGLIGGCLADISLNWNLLFLKTTTDADTRLRHFYVLLWLGSDVVLNCLLGFTPFVDNFTHLGGFMYGFCCGISTIERLAVGFFGINADKCSRLGSTVMRFFGLIISIIAIMVTTVVLVQSDGVTSPCHGCRYISCVPFPFKAEEKWWYCDDCDVVAADLFRKSDGEDGLIEQINLYCPNGEVEEILIAGDGVYETEVLQRALPTYCRAHCEEVFAPH